LCKIKMENMGTICWLIGMLIFIAGALAMAYFGFNQMDKLNEKVPEINDLTDVRIFLEECKNTLIDCDRVLLERLTQDKMEKK